MRTMLATVPLLLLTAGATPAEVRAQAERFLGAWTLVEWTNVNRSGEAFFPYGENPVGQIIYTDTGRMTAALMSAPEGSGGDPRQFVAYWGDYTVDMSAGTVTHHVEGADASRMIGTDQLRYFRFDGDDRLILSPGGRSELTWQRVR